MTAKAFPAFMYSNKGKLLAKVKTFLLFRLSIKCSEKEKQTFHASICNIALNEGKQKGRQKSSLHLGVIRPIATGAFGGSAPQIFGAPPNFVA